MAYHYGPLGRREPTDWKHVEKYALTTEPVTTGTPGVFGISWHSGFDAPKKVDSKWWIGLNGLGIVRGGHCICAKPHGISDSTGWWAFYDQGQEGACVGFGEARMMSLLRRVRFDAEWLYHQAQLTDEYADTPPAEGTSVRAGMNILRLKGIQRPSGRLDPGISTYRWATDWTQVRAALGIPDDVDGVPLLNSWGKSGYPHVVWITDEAGRSVLEDENGEFAVPTDK